jgi:hypothetical protein
LKLKERAQAFITLTSPDGKSQWLFNSTRLKQKSAAGGLILRRHFNNARKICRGEKANYQRETLNDE